MRFLFYPLLLLLPLTTALGISAAAVPTDFVQETFVSGLGQPVDMAHLPDGRLLVAEQKTGNLRLILPDGTLGANAVLTVPGLQTAGVEEGLLSLAIDPGWPNRPYIYCHYTAASPSEMRLSRFRAQGSLSDPASLDLSFDPLQRVDLLSGIPNAVDFHNGGTLVFGPAGNLYLSLGDDGDPCAAQILDDFRGKILRLKVDALGDIGPVDPSDLIAAGNPFVGQGEIASLVWALGLRNPFRMALDRQTSSLLVGDVGQNTREEISHVQAGGQNLGWPYFEGTFDYAEPAGCPDPTNLQFLDPIYDYGRTEGRTVIAGAVYRWPSGASAVWPTEYLGDLFFVDFYQGNLIRLTGTDQTWQVAAPVAGQPNPGHWATGLTWAVDLTIGPEGALYYLNLFNGSLHRIRYTGPPTASSPPPTSRVHLRQNRPNPFNPRTSIPFELREASRVRVSIHSLDGRFVRELLDSPLEPGSHEVVWDGKSRSGQPVASGVYVVRVWAGDETRSRQMALIR